MKGRTSKMVVGTEAPRIPVSEDRESILSGTIEQPAATAYKIHPPHLLAISRYLGFVARGLQARYTQDMAAIARRLLSQRVETKGRGLGVAYMMGARLSEWSVSRRAGMRR